MLTETEYEELAKLIMTKYGYPFHEVMVILDKQPKHSIAYICPWVLTIHLSPAWFKCNGADFAVHILKHEIAHIKYSGHGPAFKAECLRMGIRTKAMLRNKDFNNHGWHFPKGHIVCGKLVEWAPAQYCCYKDCEALI